MTEKEKKFLSDILNSIALIADFTSSTKLFNQYQIDLKTKGAVERHLGIIGEAVNKYLRESDKNQLANAAKIVSLRNRLIHSYDNVDDSIIWSILIRHLPLLRDEVEKKINDESAS